MLKMNCKICNTENNSCFSGRILNKYDIKYFHCANCGFVQTEQPYWLDEAYNDPINVSDTGYMQRNLSLSKSITNILYYVFDNNGKYLDYAGGYGVFTRLMRDIGFDYYWDDKYTKNLFSIGFEWNKSMKIDAVTSFESFEHFVDPMAEINSILKISDTIIFSTVLYPDPLPKPNDWWYYGLEHGQHISFFSEKTFRYIGEKLKINYYRISGIHIFTHKKISMLQRFFHRINKSNFDKLSAKLVSKTQEDNIKMSGNK